ncbi:MAG: hypothetical protein V1725_01835 [archaeon]
MRIRKTLESIVKRSERYLPIAGITALQTPLHEGLHAGLAEILPHTHCAGIIMQDTWYTGILEKITAGYIHTGTLPAYTAAQTLITAEQDTIGYLSSAVVAAGPETLTMSLSLYWAMTAVTNIRKSGSRMYAVACAYGSMGLAQVSKLYIDASIAYHQPGMDHYNFTSSMLQAAHLPESLAAYVTVLGAGIMIGSAAYIAGLFKKTKHKKATPVT